MNTARYLRQLQQDEGLNDLDSTARLLSAYIDGDPVAHGLDDIAAFVREHGRIGSLGSLSPRVSGYVTGIANGALGLGSGLGELLTYPFLPSDERLERASVSTDPGSAEPLSATEYVGGGLNEIFHALKHSVEEAEQKYPIKSRLGTFVANAAGATPVFNYGVGPLVDLGLGVAGGALTKVGVPSLSEMFAGPVARGLSGTGASVAEEVPGNLINDALPALSKIRALERAGHIATEGAVAGAAYDPEHPVRGAAVGAAFAAPFAAWPLLRSLSDKYQVRQGLEKVRELIAKNRHIARDAVPSVDEISDQLGTLDKLNLTLKSFGQPEVPIEQVITEADLPGMQRMPWGSGEPTTSPVVQQPAGGESGLPWGSPDTPLPPEPPLSWREAQEMQRRGVPVPPERMPPAPPPTGRQALAAMLEQSEPAQLPWEQQAAVDAPVPEPPAPVVAVQAPQPKPPASVVAPAPIPSPVEAARPEPAPELPQGPQGLKVGDKVGFGDDQFRVESFDESTVTLAPIGKGARKRSSVKMPRSTLEGAAPDRAPQPEPEQPLIEARPPEALLPWDITPAPDAAFPAPPNPRSAALGSEGEAYSALVPGAKIRYRYRAVPISDLRPNDEMVQPRDRSRVASHVQVGELANRWDAGQYFRSADTLDRGPIIVGPDMVVESGSGRAQALPMVKPDRMSRFLAEQREIAATHGIDPASIGDDMVVVRERLTPNSELARMYGVPESGARRRFAEDANASASMGMSPIETARADAARISDSAIASLHIGETQDVTGALGAAQNRTLVADMLRGLPANERAALVTEDASRLNPAGIIRLKNAIAAKVFGDTQAPRLLEGLAEGADPSSPIKRVETGVFSGPVLTKLARIRARVAAGELPPVANIVEDIPPVVEKLGALRRNGMLVDDYLRQAPMFGGRELTPSQEALLRRFDDAKSPKQVRDFLNQYANAAERLDAGAQGELGAMERKLPSREGLLQSVTEAQGTLFTPEQRAANAATAAVDAGAKDPYTQAGAVGPRPPKPRIPVMEGGRPSTPEQRARLVRATGRQQRMAEDPGAAMAAVTYAPRTAVEGNPMAEGLVGGIARRSGALIHQALLPSARLRHYAELFGFMRTKFQGYTNVENITGSLNRRVLRTIGELEGTLGHKLTDVDQRYLIQAIKQWVTSPEGTHAWQPGEVPIADHFRDAAQRLRPLFDKAWNQNRPWSVEAAAALKAEGMEETPEMRHLVETLRGGLPIDEMSTPALVAGAKRTAARIAGIEARQKRLLIDRKPWHDPSRDVPVEQGYFPLHWPNREAQVVAEDLAQLDEQRAMNGGNDTADMQAQRAALTARQQALAAEEAAQQAQMRRAYPREETPPTVAHFGPFERSRTGGGVLSDEPVADQITGYAYGAYHKNWMDELLWQARQGHDALRSNTALPPSESAAILDELNDHVTAARGIRGFRTNARIAIFADPIVNGVRRLVGRERSTLTNRDVQRAAGYIQAYEAFTKVGPFRFPVLHAPQSITNTLPVLMSGKTGMVNGGRIWGQAWADTTKAYMAMMGIARGEATPLGALRPLFEAKANGVLPEGATLFMNAVESGDLGAMQKAAKAWTALGDFVITWNRVHANRAFTLQARAPGFQGSEMVPLFRAEGSPSRLSIRQAREYARAAVNATNYPLTPLERPLIQQGSVVAKSAWQFKLYPTTTATLFKDAIREGSRTGNWQPLAFMTAGLGFFGGAAGVIPSAVWNPTRRMIYRTTGIMPPDITPLGALVELTGWTGRPRLDVTNSEQLFHLPDEPTIPGVAKWAAGPFAGGDLTALGKGAADVAQGQLPWDDLSQAVPTVLRDPYRAIQEYQAGGLFSDSAHPRKLAELPWQDLALQGVRLSPSTRARRRIYLNDIKTAMESGDTATRDELKHAARAEGILIAEKDIATLRGEITREKAGHAWHAR